jgi:predicted GIY-YIG superfamily endonuclease
MYSKSHGVLKLLWTETHTFKVLAEKRESQIKKWTRGKKLALAAGDIDLLKKLSRSKSGSTRSGHSPLEKD